MAALSDQSASAAPPLTYAQLHEAACVVCGSEDQPLFPAGHREVDGLTWVVVACSAHAAVTR